MIISTPIKTVIQSRVIFPPGDKSISHRALILAAIASGVTEIKHCLKSDDCAATLQILRQLGVPIEWHNNTVRVDGVGLHGLKAPTAPLDCGNSGTCMRLLSGLLVGQAFDSVLIGDMSLSQRPMMRIVTPLRQMGAKIDSDNGLAPLKIFGKNKLKAIQYRSPVASAQVKSCILLAGLYATGDTYVIESMMTRDHTERMLPFFRGGNRRVFQVPGDLSSAAFFMVLASLMPDAELVLCGVGVNPTRTGVIDILKAMGAHIEQENQRFYGPEPVADMKVRAAKLRGVHISHAVLVRAIDEFPVILLAAALASGQTRIDGINELRHKESDRVHAMATGLKSLGIAVAVEKDYLVVEGGVLAGGTVDAFSDHRVAMAFLVGGAVAKAPIQVLNTSAISTSFPAFVAMANELGCVMDDKKDNS